MRVRNIGDRCLQIVDNVLRVVSEDDHDYIIPRLEALYIAIKQLNTDNTKAHNGGKLPNPDHVGHTEHFWRKKFRQVVKRRCSIKRVIKYQRPDLKYHTDVESRIARLEECLKQRS